VFSNLSSLEESLKFSYPEELLPMKIFTGQKPKGIWQGTEIIPGFSNFRAKNPAKFRGIFGFFAVF
jgi:hypothetical protein